MLILGGNTMGLLGIPTPAEGERASDSLLELPNIGKNTAALLAATGIKTPDDLRRTGAIQAALSIAELRPTDPPCQSMLSGLEGAIRGVRWHTIPKDERKALWQAYQRRIRASGAGST